MATKHRKTPRRLSSRHNLYWALLVVILIIAAVLAYRYTHGTSYDKPNQSPSQSANQPGAAAGQNSTSSNMDNKAGQNTGSKSRLVGGASDTGGQAAASTNSSQWTTSASGVITVRQPAANSTLASGSQLIGTAKVDTVHFRLSDNAVGVIAQGVLNVANGKYSGTLGFTPHSTSGRLDVFNTNADGVELNEVHIPVKFQL